GGEAQRPKGRTRPPPPPGSSKRKALDDALVIESSDTPARKKPPSAPPPIPPRKPTQQVSALNAPRAPTDVHSSSASAVIDDQAPPQGAIDPTKSIVVKSDLDQILDDDDPSAQPVFDRAKLKAGPSKSGLPKLDLGASSRPVFPLPAEQEPRGSVVRSTRGS